MIRSKNILFSYSPLQPLLLTLNSIGNTQTGYYYLIYIHYSNIQHYFMNGYSCPILINCYCSTSRWRRRQKMMLIPLNAWHHYRSVISVSNVGIVRSTWSIHTDFWWWVTICNVPSWYSPYEQQQHDQKNAVLVYLWMICPKLSSLLSLICWKRKKETMIQIFNSSSRGAGDQFKFKKILWFSHS